MSKKIDRILKTCASCGKEFSVRHTFVEQRFCSRKCHGISMRLYSGDRTCVQCGKVFHPNGRRGAKLNVCCSLACYHLYANGPNHPSWGKRKARISVKCANCQGEIKFTNSQYARRYCSRACWRNHNANGGHARGDNSVGSVRTKTFKNGYKVNIVKCEDGVWRKEHRIIAERVIGRPLSSTEIVHHRNGNPVDNRPENLEPMNRKRHMALHHEAELIGLSVMCANEWIPTAEGMGC
jgi:endogenous inhibitor of DNA gyrase (YacG/DUF329 family)